MSRIRRLDSSPGKLTQSTGFECSSVTRVKEEDACSLSLRPSRNQKDFSYGFREREGTGVFGEKCPIQVHPESVMLNSALKLPTPACATKPYADPAR